MEWLVAIIVGGIAGWLASIVMRRDASMGIFLNIIVGKGYRLSLQEVLHKALALYGDKVNAGAATVTAVMAFIQGRFVNDCAAKGMDSEAVDAVALRALLTELAQLLANYDTAVNDRIEQARPLLRAALGEVAGKLERQIRGFDYELAAETVQALLMSDKFDRD